MDLTESNPTVVGFPEVEESAGIAEAFRLAALLPYAPDPRGLPSARQAVAHRYAAAGSPIDPERLILTASSSESYSLLWKLLCDPGDTVLVPEPSYPLFEYLALLEGVATLPYRLAHDGTRNGTWRLDLDSVDEALAAARTRVGALVVVSPNNPTGSVLEAAELAALDRRAAEAGFALVADEVFSDYVEQPNPTMVRCVAARSTAALTVSLGGLSKSCGLPQLKLGWMAVGGPAPIARLALERLDLIADTYLSVGTPVQAALPELFRAGAVRRGAISSRVAQNRRSLIETFGPRSPLTVLRADGGWTAIVRLPAVLTDEGWALAFLEKDGVLVYPGYFFDLRGATYVVVSLLPPLAIFEESIRKIAARVKEVTG